MRKLSFAFIAPILLSALLLFTSCGEAETDRLGYQDSAFSVRADITVGDMKLPVRLESSPGDTDSDPRRVKLTVLDGIISGVGFEYDGENLCLVSGGLIIPVSDPELLSGIREVISLFSIDKNGFCGSAETGEGTLVTYSEDNGAKKYEVIVSDSLPKRITATLGERVIIADINEFLPG